MLDTPSLKTPVSYLSRQLQADMERVQQEQNVRTQSHRQRVWNILIPACAVSAELLPNIGVRYLHPTKGYRTVGKKRFAIRGVL